jgi:type III restriction enzyme
MIEKGTSKIEIKNGDNEPMPNGQHSYISEDSFKKIFAALAEKLTKRTIYKLDLDKDKFIAECIYEINDTLRNRKVKNIYEITTAGVTAEDSGRIGIGEAKTRTVDSNVEDNIIQKSDFELANIIMYHTSLPRFAIFRILSGIEKKILLSNQDILDMVIKKIIVYKLNEAKAASIRSYEVINGYEFDDKVIFEADNINEEMLEAEKKVYQSKESERRAVNKYYRVDSDGEYDFAENLDDDPNVLLYTKLKKGGFVIDTPYGNYSPDWAVVYKQANGEIKLYFIVETKYGKEWNGLSDIEQNKIKCGRLHFQAIAGTTNDKLKFDWVNSYDDFKEKARV